MPKRCNRKGNDGGGVPRAPRGGNAKCFESPGSLQQDASVNASRLRHCISRRLNAPVRRPRCGCPPPYTMSMLQALLGLLTAVAVPAVTAVELDPNSLAILRAIESHRVVLLGEVHDNAAQHALRIAALRQWVVAGARPAIAFEQFDRERQSDIDRARRERPKDFDYLIAQAKSDPGWQWEYYGPFVALALEYELPIVAANLSRGDAMRVAIEGWPAVFDPATRSELRLDTLPADFRRKHETAIAVGHCNLLPADALPARARAQMARDIVMAQSIRPYLERGVVLLAGNGHVRRDIGVPFWLMASERESLVSIGMLERDDDDSASESTAAYNVYVITERAERADPCKDLTQRLR